MNGSRPSASMTVETISRLEDLQALAGAWESLAKAAGTPLLGPDWMIACAKSFYDEDQLHTLVARDGDGLCGVLPLVRRRRAGISWLTLMGVDRMHEPSGVLARDAATLHRLVETVMALRVPMALERLPQDQGEAPSWGACAGGRGLLARRITAPSRYAPIDGDWDGFYQHLSSQRRYDLRRAQRRSGGEAAITLERHRPDIDAVSVLLDRAWAVEAASWKGRNASSVRDNAAMHGFFRCLGERLAAQRSLEIAFLRIQGEDAATQIAIRYADRKWVLKIGYNERWRHCSPGVQLMAAELKAAFADDFRGFEFLGSDEPWLRPWAAETHEHLSLVYYPFSVAGMVAAGRDGAGVLRRRLQTVIERD